MKSWLFEGTASAGACIGDEYVLSNYHLQNAIAALKKEVSYMCVFELEFKFCEHPLQNLLNTDSETEVRGQILR